jgi:hypothetical protein
MREAQERERLGPPFAPPCVIQRRQSAELDQAGLVFVQRQLELRHSLSKINQHPPSTIRVLEPHHEVVGVPYAGATNGPTDPTHNAGTHWRAAG